MISERRLFPASQTTTTDAGISWGFFGNIYISVADQNPDGGLTVRIWNHPFVDWIWAGGLMMAFGGAVSMADRSLRVARSNGVARPGALGHPSAGRRFPNPVSRRLWWRRRRRVKRLIFLAPVAFFGLLIAAFAVGLGRDPTKLPSTLIDKPLPVFEPPGGAPGRCRPEVLGRGGQPHLLNVFASWCRLRLLPHRAPGPAAAQGSGVPIDGLDWKDEPVAGAQYLVDQGDPYRLAGNDKSGRAGIDLGVAGVPETFLVDGRGRVRYKVIGPISGEDCGVTIKPVLDKLCAEGCEVEGCDPPRADAAELAKNCAVRLLPEARNPADARAALGGNEAATATDLRRAAAALLGSTAGVLGMAFIAVGVLTAVGPVFIALLLFEATGATSSPAGCAP